MRLPGGRKVWELEDESQEVTLPSSDCGTAGTDHGAVIRPHPVPVQTHPRAHRRPRGNRTGLDAGRRKEILLIFLGVVVVVVLFLKYLQLHEIHTLKPQKRHHASESRFGTLREKRRKSGRECIGNNTGLCRLDEAGLLLLRFLRISIGNSVSGSPPRGPPHHESSLSTWRRSNGASRPTGPSTPRPGGAPPPGQAFAERPGHRGLTAPRGAAPQLPAIRPARGPGGGLLPARSGLIARQHPGPDRWERESIRERPGGERRFSGECARPRLRSRV